ncbi:MAG: hypothetical protein QOD76_1462 [Solirubrobacteraceae bacterium]|nr:hypothetical protein [Solirubrobacteraceae bacterium]
MTPPGATAAAARTARRSRAARPAVAPRLPRRVSGPARPGSKPQRGVARPQRGGTLLHGLVAGLLARARTLPDARIVDRMVRGPAWIALIGFLLMGLVAMQVSQLKLSASVSRAVQQGANLERRNGELQATVSRLSAEQRLQDIGARLGMFMPAAGAIHFLKLAPPRDATRAASALRSDRPVSVSSSTPVPEATTDTPAVPDQTPAAPTSAGALPQAQAQAPLPGGTAAPPSALPPAPADAATTGAASAPAGSGTDGQG